MWYIETTICNFNNKLQNILLKNSFIWKNENDWKNTYIQVLKVILNWNLLTCFDLVAQFIDLKKILLTFK
jgi:hypothetical protein